MHSGHMDSIEVRPFSSSHDCERVVDYFLNADSSFLRGMGVDPNLLPDRESWLRRLIADLERDDQHKQACFVAWLHNGEAIGHSSINKIEYGKEAYIHLHMWRPDLRKAGLGTELFTRSVRMFIERFRLKRLVCEPWAENPAPNRVLLKAGFELTRRYRTVPGPINTEQDVNRYELVTRA
jgi:[ribosomal protein S5]-alanine N-acetyltransferase